MTAGSRLQFVSHTVGDSLVTTTYLPRTSLRDGTYLPLAYETLVYGGPWGEWQHRTTVDTAALEVHTAVVAALREGRSPDQVLPSYSRREVT